MAKRNLSRREFLGASAKVAAGLSLGAALAACRPTPTPVPKPAATTAAPTKPAATTAPPATPAPQKPIVLRYQRDETPGEQRFANILRVELATKYPNVVLQDEPRTTGWVEKTVAAFVAGTAPDVTIGYGDYFLTFANKGALLDLTEAANSWGDYDKIAPAARADFTLKGRVFGVAYCYDPCTAMYYHPTLFQKDGVPVPDDKWTYDDFKQACIKLTKKDSSGKVVQWAYNGAETISNWGWLRALGMIWSYGGRKYDDNLEHCLFTQPEAMEPINMLWELKAKYNASPTPEQAGKLNYYQMFASGQCVFQACGPWAVGTYQQMMKEGPFKDEWAIGLPPRGPKGRKAWGAGAAMAVNKDTKNRELAIALVRLITGPEQACNIAKVGQRIPARFEGAACFVQPGKPDGQDTFGKILNECWTEPQHPTNEVKINDILNAAWDEFMILNKRSPKEALGDAMPKIDKLLQEKA